MDDLRHPFSGHAHRRVGPVRADVRAHLAHGRAAETAGALLRAAVRAERSLLPEVRGRIFLHVRADTALETAAGNGRGGLLRVRDALHDRGRAGLAVAHRIESGNGGHKILIYDHPASFIEGAACVPEERGVHALPYRTDHGIRGQTDLLSRLHRRTTAGRVRLPERADRTDELPVPYAHRGEQLAELHAVVQRHLQFLLVRRHIALRAPVDQGDLLHAGNALRCPRGVHGGVSSADDDHLFSGLQRFRSCLCRLQEVERVQCLTVFQRISPLLPGADRRDDVRKALRLQLLHGTDLPSRHDLCAVGRAQGDIPVNGLLPDPEGRDREADDPAGLLPFFKDRHRNALPGEEGRRRESRRTAADDRGAPAVSVSALRKRREHLPVSAFCRPQLRRADADALLVMAAHAAVRTGMRADGAGDEGQGVPLKDDPQGVLRPSLLQRGEISRDILGDRAGGAAGSLEAVDERQRLAAFPPRKRLHGLLITGIRTGRQIERCRLRGIDPGKRRARVFEQLRDPAQPLIAAGL